MPLKIYRIILAFDDIYFDILTTLDKSFLQKLVNYLHHEDEVTTVPVYLKIELYETRIKQMLVWFRFK